MVSRVIFIVILATGFSPALAYAETVELPPKTLSKADCPDTDFSAQMGPARYQGSGGYMPTGMCHAFAAADLITVNQDLPPDKRISALDVNNVATTYRPKDILKDLPAGTSAIESKRRVDDRDGFIEIHEIAFDMGLYSWGGFPNIDVESYNQEKFACSEKDLPSEVPEENANYKHYAMDKIIAAEKSKQAALKKWKKQNPCLKPGNVEALKAFNMEAGYFLRRQITDDLRKKCDKNLKIKKMVSHHLPMEAGEAAKKSIELFKQGIPVAIGYNQSVLDGPTLKRDSGHASSVAGSRWNEKTQTCEFKIRESYGQKCQETTWDCDKGEYWIPEQQYSQTVTRLFYIDKQK